MTMQLELTYSINKWQDSDKKHIVIDAYSKIKNVTLKGRLYEDDCNAYFDTSNNKIIELIKSKKITFVFSNCEFIREKTTQQEDFKIKTKKFKYIIIPSGSYEGAWALKRSLIVNDINYGEDQINTYSHASIHDVIDDALEDIEEGLC